MFSITKISFKFGDLKCSKLFSKTGIEDFLILLCSLKADKMADYKLYEKRKGYIYREGYKMGKSTLSIKLLKINWINHMKTVFLLTVIILGVIPNICNSQVETTIDSLVHPKYLSVNEKLELESEWLRDMMASHDSLINLIATKANAEYKDQTDIRYIAFLTSSLLDLQRDTAFRVVLINLASYPYISHQDPVHLMTNQKTFPVLEAIKKSNRDQISMLKYYIIRSNYLDKVLSNDEIGILKFLLVDHDPLFLPNLNLARYSGQRLVNVQAILNWSQP